MARHQLALDLDTSGAGRGVTIYAHVDASDPDAAGILDNTLTPVLVEQIRTWCETAGTKVTIKPVIDLAADPETEAYRPTEAIKEQVRLRDRTCVFPAVQPPPHRPRPHRPVRLRRPDLRAQPRDALPPPPPRQDPQPLALRDGQARALPLDQPHRRHLPRRPQAPTTLTAPHAAPGTRGATRGRHPPAARGGPKASAGVTEWWLATASIRSSLSEAFSRAGPASDLPSQSHTHLLSLT